MNIQDNDILIHCTDNPGRVTFLRTSILQKQKTDESLSVDSAYNQCIQDLLKNIFFPVGCGIFQHDGDPFQW